MPFASKKQQAWAHTANGTKALGGPAKVDEWDSATKPEEAELPERKGTAAQQSAGMRSHARAMALRGMR